MASSTDIFLLLLFLFLTHITLHHSVTLPSDVSSLKAFKASISPTSIPPSSCLSSWNFSGPDPCTLPRTIFFTCGIVCDSSASRVTGILLDPAGYAGTLSPLVSKLTHLVTLDLSDNSFSGVIPLSVLSLPSLKTLALRLNSFHGSLPPSVSNLRSLESLDISRNSLSGSLPNFSNSMNRLTTLDLSFNQFTGSVPAQLPLNLIVLALRGNFLSGALSKSSFNGLNRLQVIQLGANSLSGSVPGWLFLMPSLQQVDLANNSFAGVEIWKPARVNSPLVAVDLGFNKIAGFLPSTFLLYPSLASLTLRNNLLRGSIPAEYGKKRTLRRLFLEGNYLSGSPPAGLISGEIVDSGSLANNCLVTCPLSSQLCGFQKPAVLCQ